ncbi:hypothetical protein FRB98_005891 [Tulasnella sp. 332]|nr:hypothetical protein FRB98_005891 [Tulasnella sp. 332]
MCRISERDIVWRAFTVQDRSALCCVATPEMKLIDVGELIFAVSRSHIIWEKGSERLGRLLTRCSWTAFVPGWGYSSSKRPMRGSEAAKLPNQGQALGTASHTYAMLLTNPMEYAGHRWTCGNRLLRKVVEIHPGAAHDTFYTDPKIIAAYKKYLSFVVPAFKNHPALFSWELANDPRCQGASGTTTSSTCNTVTITTWVKEIAAFVKSLDPNHLVGAGDSGFFCTQPTCPKVNGPSPTKRSNGWDKRWVFDGPAYNGHFGIDTLDICNDPNIDLCTIQFFPDQQDYSETPGGSPGLTGASVTSGIDFINFHHSEGPNKPLMLSAVAITNQDNAADLNNFDSTTVGTPPGQPVATAAEQLSAFNSIFSGNGNVTALFTWEQQVTGITSGAIISKKRQTNIGSSPNDGMQVSPGTPVYQSAINNNKAMAAPPT